MKKVVNASGGRTGCFLYRGTLVTPAPRSSTPDCLSPRQRGAVQQTLDALLPGLGEGFSEQAAGLSAYEGQELTLYFRWAARSSSLHPEQQEPSSVAPSLPCATNHATCSYEEASPKAKLRGGSAAGPAAPWRAILRDQQDELVYCLRGLPPTVQLDRDLRLATWGPAIALAFPAAGVLRSLAGGLCASSGSRLGPPAALPAHSWHAPLKQTAWVLPSLPLLMQRTWRHSPKG